MQNLTAGQETPVSTKPEAGLMTAVASRRHLTPFQCSANGNSLPDLATNVPTASQTRTVAQETRVRKLERACGVLGVRWIRHRTPFQYSANVAVAPPRVWLNPTAKQLLTERQDRPVNLLPDPPCAGGDGTGTIRHRDLVKTCASGLLTVPPCR